MKRLCRIFLVAALMVSCVPSAAAISTSATSAILVDGASGRILYQQNPNEPRLIASITKLMTALVALESGRDITEIVTISKEWVGAEGSSIYLSPGEEISLEALLYGLLLRSGNDAALAIAGYCGGSVEEFVALMNQKAAALGMTNSSFANPNGLNDEGHFSTAHDMALLARACLENETMAQMVATKSITQGTRSFTNHNKLLWRYEGCIGMKTGFTEKAGRTLVTAAERDGTTLICVTLNDPNDWSDHAALFDYGFANFAAKEYVTAGETRYHLPVTGSMIPFVPVMPTQSGAIALSQGEAVEVEVRWDVTSLTAPVTAHKPVGEMIFRLNGYEIKRVPLETAGEAPQNLVQSQTLLEKLWAGIGARAQR